MNGHKNKKVQKRIRQHKSCCQVLVVLISITTTCSPTEGGNLDLDEITGKVENLKIKNNIGYHFKKKVRQVAQELFISRKMDTTLLIQGIDALKQLANKLNGYCSGIPSRLNALKSSEFKTLRGQTHIGADRFVHLSQIKDTTFIEAKARCQALGKQLPEIYDDYSMLVLSSLLREKQLTAVWAGVQYDSTTAMQRFISTGMPLYRGFSKLEVYYQGKMTTMRFVLDNSESSFLYAHNGTLCTVKDFDSPGSTGAYGDSTWRDKVLTFSQITAPVICENKWDGKGFEMIDPTMDQKHITMKDLSIYVMSADQKDPKTVPIKGGTSEITYDKSNSQYDWKVDQEVIEMANAYQMTCNSIVEHANETHKNLKSKTDNLLALVDISYHMEQFKDDKRRKRAATSFLGKVIFRTGFKAIWGLFGFVQQIRQDIKIHNLEKQIVKNQRDTASNSKLIKDLSLTLKNQSIAVQQLQILTANLEKRIEALEQDMQALQERLSSTEARLEIAVKLQLISNLIIRTEQILRDGYNTLEDIVHYSVLGQTSPKVLPLSQIELVQREVQKISSADLDTDFSKMQSIVVSDPNDPNLLLIIINAAAISKSTTDLITITPIPVYSGSKTVKPVLSYQTIILNQWIGTYVILTEQEETNCLLHRCYVHGMEKSIYDNTCGIPQYLDKNLEACAYEEIYDDNKAHLISALPDGAFFSFKDTVDAQLFCTDNNLAGRLQKVSGTGVLQIPNGCTLSVTDLKGRNSKLKGPPLHNFIQGQDVVLVDKLPLSVIMESAGLANKSHTLLDQMLEQHLGQMQNDLSVTNVKLKIQETAIITIIATTFATIIIIIIAAYLTYRFSSRVRERMKFIWGIIDNLRNRVEDILPHIPFRNTFRKLLPIPLKMFIKEEKRKEKSEKEMQMIERPRLRAIRRFTRRKRKEEPTMRWSDLHRDTVRDTQLTPNSHTYVTLESLRVPQPQPRTLYPNVDHLMTDLKTVNREVDNREKEMPRFNFSTLRRLENDNMSITARGSVASDLDQYDSSKTHN